MKSLSKIFVAIGCLASIGCTHSSSRNPAAEKIQVGAELSAAQATKLTDAGDNFQSRFSHDGSSILYISKDRTTHKNQQIYEWSFVDKKERRITYSDGDTYDPQYTDADRKIMYLSTTDAIKEHPHLFRIENQTPQPGEDTSDIFASDVSGIPIEKLTTLNAKLSDLNVPKEKTVVFIIHKDDRQQIQSLNSQNRLITWTESKDTDLHFPLQDQKQNTYWLEEDKTQTPTLHHVKLGKKPDLISTPFKTIHDLSWWDQEKSIVIMSAKQTAEDTFDNIYLFNLQTQCTASLLKQKTDLWYASPNPQKTKITVTAIQHSHRQIYILDVPQIEQCPPTIEKALPESPESKAK